MDVASYDAVIAVVGETPYAEFIGDIIWNPLFTFGPTHGVPPPGQAARQTLQETVRYPEDLAVLNQVTGKGKPVVTVLISGRPLYVNDLLNRSDAFVAAFLPGTEGSGVADMLFRDAGGAVAFDFQGRLSYSWPRSACQVPLHAGQPNDHPLFPYGYGLTVARSATVPRLDETPGPSGGCPEETDPHPGPEPTPP